MILINCICKTCGGNFQIDKWEGKSGKYCSQECYYKSRIGTKQTGKQKAAVRKNMLENNPMRNKESIEKSRIGREKTMLEKYGVLHSMHIPGVVEKRHEKAILGAKRMWETRLRVRSDEAKKQTSDTLRKHWSNPEEKARMLQGRGKAPNKLEAYFNAITPSNVRYVGDGSFWRTLPNGVHKNPDFKVKGQNKVIEIFGNYWHKDEDPKQLIKLYETSNLKCLIIWEKDLREDEKSIIKKVKEFIMV